jgi:hypothetical protein
LNWIEWIKIKRTENNIYCIALKITVLGSVSGIVAKGVSYLDGNKNNKDSGLVSAGTYGAYFGTYLHL